MFLIDSSRWWIEFLCLQILFPGMGRVVNRGIFYITYVKMRYQDMKEISELFLNKT